MRRTFLTLSILICSFLGTVSAEPIRIMGIGNSFTVDALEQHFQPLLDAEGVDAVIGYPYRGGTWLSQHDAWSQRTDTLPYNYRKFKNGQFTSTGLATYSLKMALEDEPWDYVLIQSDHDSAGIYDSYVPYMEHLIDFIHENCSNPNVKIGFYMTWAYDEGSTYSSFKLYNKDQQTMYNGIIAAAQLVMANHPELELLIPGGTAVDIAPAEAAGATAGVIGMASYAAAGLQDIVSGYLIEGRKVITDTGTLYDFSAIRLFWLAAAAASLLLLIFIFIRAKRHPQVAN